LTIVKFDHLKVRIGHAYIPTLPMLAGKRWTVNVENYNATDCFLYAQSAVLMYDNIPCYYRQRPQQYRQYFREFVYDEMHMKLKDLSNFERQSWNRYQHFVFG